MRRSLLSICMAGAVAVSAFCAPLAAALPSPLGGDTAGSSQPVVDGQIQKSFGAPGPYAVTSTRTTESCNSLKKAYDTVATATEDMKGELPCWGSAPYGNKPIAGVDFTYPKNIAELGKLPVIIFTPGVGVEPGMLSRQYNFLASYGYIVVTPYTLANWTGATDVMGATGLSKKAKDSKDLLYGHIDASRTFLTGHSAGGGSTDSGAGWLLPQIQGSFPGMVVRGAAPLEPGPSLVFQWSQVKVPTLIVTGEKDRICADPLMGRPMYKSIKQAPAWIGMMKGATHGQVMDDPRLTPTMAVTLAFAEYTTKNNQEAARIFVGPDYGLARDKAFMKVERNSLAAQRR